MLTDIILIIEQINVIGVGKNMKKIFIIMIGLLFAASAAFATPSSKGDMLSMNKADIQILFADVSSVKSTVDYANIVILNNDELSNTQGKGWFSRAWKRLRTFFRRHVNLEGRNAHRYHSFRR